MDDFDSVEFSEQTEFYTIEYLLCVDFYSNSKKHFLSLTIDFESTLKIQLTVSLQMENLLWQIKGD